MIFIKILKLKHRTKPKDTHGRKTQLGNLSKKVVDFKVCIAIRVLVVRLFLRFVTN
jgi:hypothetical protein